LPDGRIEAINGLGGKVTDAELKLKVLGVVVRTVVVAGGFAAGFAATFLAGVPHRDWIQRSAASADRGIDLSWAAVGQGTGLAGADFLEAVDLDELPLGIEVTFDDPAVVEPTPTQIVTELRFTEDP
jgi:hypothetical protein